MRHFNLEKYLKIIGLTLLLVFYTSLLVYKITLPKADDMARHLKNGEIILHGNFDILTKNVYSYTQTNFPVVNHHWFSGVVYYILYLLTGWGGLELVKIILLLATFLLLFRLSVKKADFWLVTVCSLPAIILLMERTSLRPENFSYLFMAIFLSILAHTEKHPESKKIFWLIPLQILWVNMHIFFFWGPCLVGAFLLQNVIWRGKKAFGDPLVRKLAAVTIILAAVCLLNPNFITGALYPFTIFQNYGFQVAENESLFRHFHVSNFWDDFSTAFYIPAVIILAISFIPGFKKKQKPIFYAVISTAAAVTGFLLVRNIVILGIIFLPVITDNLSDTYLVLKEKFRQEAPGMTSVIGKVLVILVFGLTLWLTNYFGSKINSRGIGLDYRSKDSANFFKENKLTGPIFNDYDIGSYLIFNFYPQEKVWIDNRPEAYPADFLNNVSSPLISDEADWKKAVEKYGFNVIFFYQYDQGQDVRQFLANRIHDPQWALVYVDIYSMILVKNAPQNQAIINKFQITPENAPQKLAYLVNSQNDDDRITAADTFNLLDLEDLATRTYFDVLSKDPNKPKIWLVLGEWELNKNDYRSPLLALMFLDKTISLGYQTAETYSYLGQAYAKLNRPENARWALKKSLEINPEWRDSMLLLQRINENNK